MGAPAPARQDAALFGGARPGAAGGRGGAQRPSGALQGARAARPAPARTARAQALALWTFAGRCVLVYIVCRVHIIDRLCVKLCGENGRYKEKFM